jgi:ribosomal protein S18 acetylase RimI-like enzyme
MNFEILTEPFTETLKKEIFAGFTRHAIEQTGQDGIGEPLAFVAYKESSLAGACVVEHFWGTLHIKFFLVLEQCRGQGLGKKLLSHALTYGRAQQFPLAFVETMSFQALDFYLKSGFTLEYSRTGYIKNLSFHYLKLDLSKT